MSGKLTRLNILSLTDDKVEFYTNPILVPPTNFVKFSASLYENGPPIVTVLVNPGTGVQQSYFGGWLLGGTYDNTTLWLRAWEEDAGGNVISEASRWVSTFPQGSVDDTGPEFWSCGDFITEDEDRVTWNGAKSPTTKGGEVA